MLRLLLSCSSVSRSQGCTRRAVVVATVLALTLTAGVAQASPDTLRLALEDLVVGVADVVAAPVTAGLATAENTSEVSDNGFLQALYVVPGWLGLTALQIGQSTLRVGVGALELIPGVLLFPFPGVDVPEGLNVFRQQDPVVDLQNPLAENPSWLRYVPPITPFTIDVRFAPMSPWALYEVSTEPGKPEGPAMAGAAE